MVALLIETAQLEPFSMHMAVQWMRPFGIDWHCKDGQPAPRSDVAQLLESLVATCMVAACLLHAHVRFIWCINLTLQVFLFNSFVDRRK